MTKIYLPNAKQSGVYKVAELRENDQLLSEFGYSNALAVTTAMLTATNQAVVQGLSVIAETTTNLTEAAPIANAVRMEEVDEFGNVRTQRASSSASRSFPMKLRAFATGWTDHFALVGTVRDLIRMNEDAQLAYATANREDMLAALLNPVSSNVHDIILLPTIQRRTLDGVKVVPLYNGDDEVPGVNANGKTFGSGHNHYLYSAALSNDAVQGQVDTVAEHSTNANIVLHISEADAAAFRALPNFAADTAAGVIVMRADGVISTDTLNTGNTGDRKIGYFNAMYPVFVKPWMPAGYSLALDLNAPKVLKRRVPEQRVLQGLRLKGQEGNTVLTARTWEALFGFGVSNRGGASVLQFNSTNSKYNAPVNQYEE
ncbi:hypothetical protein [Deinococcus fonticola]|uniref:hypothetical protein n=1 Tax=Deinococcus fonticola TaxID=2528713 RepID=UPI0010753F7D|nr:hypothetical protein [Deinococcus fonticola]